VQVDWRVQWSVETALNGELKLFTGYNGATVSAGSMCGSHNIGRNRCVMQVTDAVNLHK